MPIDLQAKLLRAIQEKKIRRVGGEKDISVDVRTIAATHRNLNEMTRSNEFRDDLYQRLNVLKIFLPPLRERRDDIPLILNHCLLQRKQKGRRIVRFAKDAVEVLVQQPWRGNVRELLNVVERAIVNCDEEIVTAGFLRNQLEPEEYEIIPASEFVPNLGDPFSLKEIEKYHIDILLKKNDWNVARTAKILEIDRTTLDNKIEKYNLSDPR